jgi:hypothetical protein
MNALTLQSKSIYKGFQFLTAEEEGLTSRITLEDDSFLIKLSSKQCHIPSLLLIKEIEWKHFGNIIYPCVGPLQETHDMSYCILGLSVVNN